MVVARCNGAKAASRLTAAAPTSFSNATTATGSVADRIVPMSHGKVKESMVG